MTFARTRKFLRPARKKLRAMGGGGKQSLSHPGGGDNVSDTDGHISSFFSFHFLKKLEKVFTLYSGEFVVVFSECAD